MRRKKEQVGELLHCSGTGLMCLMFEAFPVVHSQDSVGSICLPMNVLDFDHKGSVDSHGFGAETLRVDVGEVKSSVDYSTAVLQLEMRLKALKCLTNILASESLTHTLHGRLFLSQYFGSEGDIDPL
jgi:hypothetical protein